MKYIIEYQTVGQGSPHPWVDTDDGVKTSKDVTALNSSTLYQFRVRASSKVPGEWSDFVQAMTQGDGEQQRCRQSSQPCGGALCLHFPPSYFFFVLLCQSGLDILSPTTKAVAGRPTGDGYQLLVAVVGSVTVTCVTILLALLALFFIRKMLLNRRRTFTYQSGSVRTRRGELTPVWRRWLVMDSCVFRARRLFCSLIQEH